MKETVKAKQFWLCKDGHEKYPLALFADKPKFNKTTKGWDAVPGSTFRLTLSESEAAAMTSEDILKELKEGGMVAVYLAT